MHLRHILVSSALLVAVLTASGFTQHYTATVCTQTITAIEQIENEPDSADENLEVIIANFRKYAKTLSYFHHHSYADAILTNLQRAKSYAVSGVTTEMCTELEAVKSALETLRKRDAISLGNLF